MTAMVPMHPAGTPADVLARDLGEAGCLVVTGLVDAAQREAIRAELAPHMAQARVAQEDALEDFYRAHAARDVVARSRAVTDELLAHEVTRQMCDAHLLPNGEYGYQLHVTAALEVGPGAREQILHREENSFTFFPEPRPNLIVASMWAISDFRADNGATLIVRQSFWPADRVPTPEEVVAAEMPAGSVLFWLGGLLHGAGANVAPDWPTA